MFEHTYMHMYIHTTEATKPIIVIYTFRVFVVHITKTKTIVCMPFCYTSWSEKVRESSLCDTYQLQKARLNSVLLSIKS